MVYRSKKDAWLMCVVWSAVLVPLGLGAYELFAPAGNPREGWQLIQLGVVVAAVLVLVSYPLNYQITPTHLVARCGFMRWRVPLDAIEEVRPSHSFLSAPAWSLDRLRVEHRKGGRASVLLISPEEKERFMRELAESAKGLELRGGRVVRVS